MSLKLRWLPTALDDLDALLEYIASDSLKAAVEQAEEVDKQVNNLATYPKMGRPGRKKGTRELVINRTAFIAVYVSDEKNKEVQILRLLHGAQKWP